jgi:4'-phosphopantetheinyl transferase
MLDVFIIKAGITLNVDNFIDILGKQEIDRYKLLKNKDDKDRFLERHVVLRKMLAKYSNLNIDEIKLSYNKFGKLDSKNIDIYFNISRTHDFFTIAVSNNPIGIDIEKIRNIKDLGMANFFCTDEELNYIDVSTSKSTAFLKLWTLKESFVKNTGKGMLFKLKRLSFNVNNNEILLKIDNKLDTLHKFILLKKLGNILSVCYMGKSIRPKITIYNKK